MTKEMNNNKFEGAYVEDPKNVTKNNMEKIFSNLKDDDTFSNMLKEIPISVSRSEFEKRVKSIVPDIKEGKPLSDKQFVDGLFKVPDLEIKDLSYIGCLIKANSILDYATVNHLFGDIEPLRFSHIHIISQYIGERVYRTKQDPSEIIKDEKFIKEIKNCLIALNEGDYKRFIRQNIQSAEEKEKRIQELNKRAVENNVSTRTQENVRTLLADEDYLNSLGLFNYSIEFYFMIIEDLISKKSDNCSDAFNDMKLILKLRDYDKTL